MECCPSISTVGYRQWHHTHHYHHLYPTPSSYSSLPSSLPHSTIILITTIISTPLHHHTHHYYHLYPTPPSYSSLPSYLSPSLSSTEISGGTADSTAYSLFAAPHVRVRSMSQSGAKSLKGKVRLRVNSKVRLRVNSKVRLRVNSWVKLRVNS